MNTVYKINVDVLFQICSKANAAKDITADCESILENLIQHEEWTCKERNQINELIQHTKDNVVTISRAIEAFAGAINQNANEYIDFINENANEAMDINQEISALYGQMCTGANYSINSSVHINETISRFDYSGLDRVSSQMIRSMNTPISILNYSGLISSEEEKT